MLLRPGHRSRPQREQAVPTVDVIRRVRSVPLADNAVWLEQVLLAGASLPGIERVRHGLGNVFWVGRPLLTAIINDNHEE